MNERRARLTQRVMERLSAAGRVCLRGAPGVGKTWTLERVADAWSGAVVRLDGAGREGAPGWNQRLARALGVALESGEAPAQREQLHAALEQRAPLLVCVDHADRIEGVADALDLMMPAGDGIRWLVSCAQELGEGWSQVEVDALERVGEDAVLTSEAARVLEEGARRLEPGFALRDEDAAHVAAIVEALGGNPAALELVGVRAPALGMGELARRLANEEMPGYVDAAFEMWWEGLEPWEQCALTRASVCHAPFGASMFEALMSGVEGADPLEQLCVLRARFRLDRVEGSPPRHAMTPAVAAFCRRKLAATGDEDAARGAHAAHIAAHAERASLRARWRKFAASEHELTSTVEDASSAATWLIARGAHEQAAWALIGETIGRWRALDLDGTRDTLERARRELPLRELSDDAHGTLLLLSGDTGSYRWNLDESREMLEVARGERAQWPSWVTLAFDIREAEMVVERREDHAEAYLRGLLERATAARDSHAVAVVLLNEGHRALVSGEHTKALGALKESMDLFEREGDPRERARAQMFVGYCHWQLEQIGEAKHALEESIATFERVGDRIGWAQGLRALSAFLVDESMRDEAHRVLDDLLEVGQRLGLVWASGAARYHLGQLAMGEGRYAEALEHTARAVVAYTRTGRTPMLVASHVQQIWGSLLTGDFDAADEALDLALAHKDEVNAPLGHCTLECLASERAARRGDIEGARAHLELAQAHQVESGLRLLTYMITIQHCLIDATLYRGEKKKRKRAAYHDAIVGALATLTATEGAEQDAPVHRSTELRFGFQVLRQRLPEELAERLDTELRDPRCEALLVDRERRTFRAPETREWVNMSRRETPYRLFDALLDGRLERPGAPIDTDALLEAAWPGEEILAEAASNRLYVTISTLRRAGLRDMIVSEGGGYMLDPDTPLMLI